VKSDVLPTIHAEPLSVPSWAPQSVAEVAREAYATGDEHTRDLITRLACDQRMRRVWRELSKRRRRDGKFMHPLGWWIDATNAEERQGVAMAKLLTAALQFVARPGATSTRRKAEQRHSHYLEMARQLRADADALRVPKSDKRWRRLTDAAKTYEEGAKNVEGNLQIRGYYLPWSMVLDHDRGGYCLPWPMILDRDRGDPTDRWLACAISYTCQALFRLPMYGLTAIIMTVALGREVTARAVRQWCAHPADKTSKNQA
jgi:hypothetical protein